MGKKNSQIHLFLESTLMAILKREAEELEVSISELCRQKLRQTTQLARMELMLQELTKSISNQNTTERRRDSTRSRRQGRGSF